MPRLLAVLGLIAAWPAHASWWWPWHDEAKPDSKPTLAPTTPVIAPAVAVSAVSALPITASSMAPPAASSALEPVSHAPAIALPALTSSATPPAKSQGTAATARYAPYTEVEWRQLLQDYQSLALCTDRYMSSAGINGKLLGVKLVQLDQVLPLANEASRLLGSKAPLRAAASELPAQAQQAAQLVLDLIQAPAGLPLGQALARKATARYYLSKVAGSACPLPADYRTLLEKAWNGPPPP